MDRLAEVRYTQVLHSVEPRPTIDRLSLDVQRILLYYQTSSFGALAIYLDDFKDGSPLTLDQSILNGFSELARTQPQLTDELTKLRRKYEFVRPNVLRKDLPAVPGGAAFYLSQVGDGLNELAAHTAP
ncbi:hypothetical protein ACFW0H_21820 [Pseudomonas sp. CR3202]|uniref:hypothetical protein n=1 Tax=Pseudomonas sp. CR3202 TaxID=3351532 RepID=UPI0028B67688